MLLIIFIHLTFKYDIFEALIQEKDTTNYVIIVIILQSTKIIKDTNNYIMYNLVI